MLSTTVAPEPLTPTEPVNALAGLLSATVPVVGSADAVVLPPTFNGPLCVMLPPVLVAARSPVVVSCPKSTAPPAVAATLPPAVVVPKSSPPPAVAVTLPPTVLVPNVRSPVPPAVATRFPVVLIGPRVSAPVSAIATDPLIGCVTG